MMFTYYVLPGMRERKEGCIINIVCLPRGRTEIRLLVRGQQPIRSVSHTIPPKRP